METDRRFMEFVAEVAPRSVVQPSLIRCESRTKQRVSITARFYDSNRVSQDYLHDQSHRGSLSQTGTKSIILGVNVVHHRVRVIPVEPHSHSVFCEAKT